MKHKVSYTYQFKTKDNNQFYEREFNSHSDAKEFSDKKLYGENIESNFHKITITVI